VTAIILSAFPAPGASVEWEDVVAAVTASGLPVKNWLKEVRGPLQTLMDAGKVVRDSSSLEHERYVLVTGMRSVRGVRVHDPKRGSCKVLKVALADEPLALVRWTDPWMGSITVWLRVDAAWTVEGGVALVAALRP